MASKIEEQILQDLRAGKEQAICELIQKHTGPLFAAALGLGFPEPDAEELVQDTFTAFLTAVKRFEGRSQLKTYLFGILYHKASETWRRQKREEATENIEEIFDRRFHKNGLWSAPPQGPEKEALSKEIMEWIEKCSQNLSLNQRSAFYLREVERESTNSICKILNVTATHLGVLLFRARNKLRECLEKNWVSQ
ncbi:MAG: sigma-70 family RNA polymerase sigma factor [Elusimicrobia bacterium]|nr:sigma-70 family RNA polymerase sigma factor [Elusimicrobiota bacterium]